MANISRPGSPIIAVPTSFLASTSVEAGLGLLLRSWNVCVVFQLSNIGYVCTPYWKDFGIFYPPPHTYIQSFYVIPPGKAVLQKSPHWAPRRRIMCSPTWMGPKNGIGTLCFCASYCLGLYTFVGHLWFPNPMDPFWESAWVLVMKTYRQYVHSIGIWSNQFLLLDGCHNCLVLHNNNPPSNASVLTCAQSCLLAVSCTTSSFIRRFFTRKRFVWTKNLRFSVWLWLFAWQPS